MEIEFSRLSSSMPTPEGVNSQKSFLSPALSKPVPRYPFPPILKPVATHLAVPPKFVTAVQLLFCGSNSQKSLNVLLTLVAPVPMYPFVQIAKPTAAVLTEPPTIAFCVQVLFAGSYSQNSLY